ncbi:MAG: hypothetical protein WCT34_05490, partial [Patescibacteria group bacterium]
MMVKKSFSWLFIVLLVAIIMVIAGGAYYLGTRSTSKPLQIFPSKTQQTSISVQPTIDKTLGPLFSG